MIKYKLVVVVLFILTSLGVNAQEHVNLTLKEAVDLALENNWKVRQAGQMIGVSTSDLKMANSIFLPSINLSETYITTSDPLTAFGLKLRQEKTTTEDFNPVSLNDPGSVDNYTTQIRIEQPIINPDGMAARKMAMLGVKASKHNLAWSKKMVTIEVRKNYFNLQMAYEQKTELMKSLDAGNANLAVTIDLFEQGMVHKADLLGAELRKTEIKSQLIEAEARINTFNSSLAHLIGTDQANLIVPLDILLNTDLPAQMLAVSNIPTERSDLQYWEMQAKASDFKLKSARNSWLPRLNAFGNYQWNDSRLAGTGASNYLFGAMLEWDIFKGGRNLASMQKANYQKELAVINYEEKLSEGKMELTRVQNEIFIAWKQLELSDLAMEQSEELFRVRTDRYAEGLEKTSDVITAEADVMNKRMSKLHNLNRYQQLIFNLEMLLEQEIIK